MTNSLDELLIEVLPGDSYREVDSNEDHRYMVKIRLYVIDRKEGREIKYGYMTSAPHRMALNRIVGQWLANDKLRAMRAEFLVIDREEFDKAKSEWVPLNSLLRKETDPWESYV